MNWRFTPEHKSLAKMPSRWPLVPVRPNGYRDLSFESSLGEAPDGLLALSDPEEPILRLELSPQGIEFLLDYLPAGDGFTERLRYAREVGKHRLWDREVVS